MKKDYNRHCHSLLRIEEVPFLFVFVLSPLRTIQHLQNGKGDAFEGTEGWQDEEGRILTGWYMRYMEGACQYVISWWFDRIKKEKVSKSKCGR